MFASSRKKNATPPKADERLRHIAFIMDGNGRWAQKRGMPREYGHRAGAANFKKLTRHCGEIGIQTVTVYAFSTENWKRPEYEVECILRLFRNYLDDAMGALEENGIRFIFLGERSVFDDRTREKMKELETASAHYPLTLNIAINYGGRDEIVHAVNEALADGATRITAEDIGAHLYTRESPPPDLIVRTGGERRLSNFLLWQSEYAELYFSPILWPDFSPDDVDAAVRDFYERNRRFGAVETV